MFWSQREQSYYHSDVHIVDLNEGSETLEFKSNIQIEENATVVLKTPQDQLQTFIVQQIDQTNRDYMEFTYFCDAEFLELRYLRVLEPTVLTGQTPESALNYGLQGTRWQIGMTNSTEVKDVEIGEFMTTLKFIRMLADAFNLEMRFRTQLDETGTYIEERFIDLIEPAGVDEGKEIVFGKDLMSISRKINNANIVTALYCIGPKSDNGRYMSIESMTGGKRYVED